MTTGITNRRAAYPSSVGPSNRALDKATRIEIEQTETVELPRFSREYLSDCELQLLAPSTLATRQVFLRNLHWFLIHRQYSYCGTAELREFLFYLAHGHKESGGRFDNPQLISPARPITIKDYYICLRSFFAWLVAQGHLAETPFAVIPKPQARVESKTALSVSQVASLLEAAKRGQDPLRDCAIISLLLDTGCRASELVAIRRTDLDIASRCCRVLGKGNKYRTVYFGATTAQALVAHLTATGTHSQRENASMNDTTPRATNAAEESEPLFVSHKTGLPLGLSGLQQIMKRLKKRCDIKCSCSPHALRRAFAVQTLRNGANVFSVQAMLGHSDLEMTRRYCALAQADVEEQHRLYSPIDRLGSDRSQMHTHM